MRRVVRLVVVVVVIVVLWLALAGAGEREPLVLADGDAEEALVAVGLSVGAADGAEDPGTPSEHAPPLASAGANLSEAEGGLLARLVPETTGAGIRLTIGAAYGSVDLLSPIHI